MHGEQRRTNSKGNKNVLVFSCQVGDFGLSFIGTNIDKGSDITHYVYTRPPEMLMIGFEYNTQCDVFA